MTSTPLKTQQEKRRFEELSPDNSQLLPDNKLLKRDERVSNLTVGSLMDAFQNILHMEINKLATKVELNSLRQDVEGWKNSVEKSIEKLQYNDNELRRKLDFYEKNDRRRNLIIKGIDAKSTQQEIMDETKIFLSVKMKISDVRAVVYVKKIKEVGNRMIVLARLESETLVREVLKNTKELAGTYFSVDRDLTVEERAIKRNLLNIKGNILQVDKSRRIKVRNNKLFIGDAEFNWKDNQLWFKEEMGLTVLNKMFNNKFANINILERVNRRHN